MIHVVCQNYAIKSVGKTTDFLLASVADKIHDSNYIDQSFYKNLKADDTVIFMYNEDALFTTGDFTGDMARLESIEKRLKNIPVNIYNRPSKHKILGCKFRYYSRFKFDSFVPQFVELTCDADVDQINFYPAIVTLSVRTLGNYRFKCDTKGEVLKALTTLKKTRKSVKYERIMAIEYINAYNDELDCYINVRFMVINNEIVDYYARPAEHWNVHTNDQLDDTEIHGQVNRMVDKYIMNNSGVLKGAFERCYKTLGNGFYSYDCIINSRGFYVCEVRLKMYDDIVRKIYKLLEYNINKFVMQERKYSDLIRYFLNTPRKKRKWSQKFLKRDDVYFDYDLTILRKKMAMQSDGTDGRYDMESLSAGR